MSIEKRGNTKLRRIKIEGYITFDGSSSIDEFSNKFEKFLRDSSFNFAGRIEEYNYVLKLNKSNFKDNLDSIWDNIIRIIGKEITEVSYNTWIKPIKPCSIDEHEIILITDNEFSKVILSQRYAQLIQIATKAVIDKDLEVKIYANNEI